jgi:Fic family protein
MFKPHNPYNDLPLLPPQFHDLESKPILKACIDARGLLGELKEIGKRIPNQSVLINSIPLLEAKDSSEIENIITTTDKLFQYSFSESKADHATKEALQYRTALKQGFDLIQRRPISTRLAEEICSILKGTFMTVRKVPGIKLANPSTEEIIYTPPEGENIIREKLKNWEEFIHTQVEIDPLVRMALMHYQFEAIHPFTDGNGRTGRVLNILFLIQEGLLEIPVLYLSRFIIQNKNDYYKNLLAVTRESKWSEWILYMLEAVIQTATWTKSRIEMIESLMSETKVTIKDKLPKIYTHELAEIIFEQPYCRIQNLVESGIAKRQTASVYLKELCKIGVLEERKEGRENIYLNPKFLEILSS